MLLIKLDVTDITELEMFLYKVDEDFEPALSSRVDLKSYARKLMDNAIIFKACDKLNVIGLVACYANDPSKVNAYIPFVAVNRDYRGRGVGRVLLNKVITELKGDGFKNLSLTVRKTSKAFYLYKNLGFKIYSEFKYDNTDIVGVNMVKEV